MSMMGMGGFRGGMPDPAASQAAAESKHLAKDVRIEAEAAQGRIDRLVLICRAMWELLQERTDLTDADLAAKVREIDQRDGQTDGKLKAPKTAACPSCGRPMALRNVKCLYCGAERPPGSPFESVL
jgi:ribosomal protein L32